MALSSLRDADLAEEVAQESLSRLLSAIREGRPRNRASLGAFARSIARNVIVDTLRSRQRLTPLGPEHDAASKENPLESLVTAEQSARLRGALERLTGKDRELLRLSFFEGLSPQELAEQTGEPATRIRKRKERALERLRLAFRGTPSHAGDSIPTVFSEARSALARPGAAE